MTHLGVWLIWGYDCDTTVWWLWLSFRSPNQKGNLQKRHAWAAHPPSAFFFGQTEVMPSIPCRPPHLGNHGCREGSSDFVVVGSTYTLGWLRPRYHALMVVNLMSSHHSHTSTAWIQTHMWEEWSMDMHGACWREHGWPKTFLLKHTFLQGLIDQQITEGLQMLPKLSKSGWKFMEVHPNDSDQTIKCIQCNTMLGELQGSFASPCYFRVVRIMSKAVF